MGRITYKTVYCCRSKTKYKAVFEEREPDVWVGIRAEAVEPVGYFEKQHLLARAKGQFNARLSATKSEEIEMKSFSFGDIKCPTCGANNISGCNCCHQVTCFSWDWNLEDVTCAVCGNSYPLKTAGTLNSLKSSESNGGASLGNSGANNPQ